MNATLAPGTSLEAPMLASDVRGLRGIVRDLQARIARFDQFPPS